MLDGRRTCTGLWEEPIDYWRLLLEGQLEERAGRRLKVAKKQSPAGWCWLETTAVAVVTPSASTALLGTWAAGWRSRWCLFRWWRPAGPVRHEKGPADLERLVWLLWAAVALLDSRESGQTSGMAGWLRNSECPARCCQTCGGPLRRTLPVRRGTPLPASALLPSARNPSQRWRKRTRSSFL